MSVLLTAADGLGYIKNPAVAQNLSVISAFHQLHCLVSKINTRRQDSTSWSAHDYSTPYGERVIPLPATSWKASISG